MSFTHGTGPIVMMNPSRDRSAGRLEKNMSCDPSNQCRSNMMFERILANQNDVLNVVAGVGSDHASDANCRPGRAHMNPLRPLREHVMAIFAAIEGAQLVARGCRDIAIYDRTIRTYRTTGLMP
ncbi:hypothetical protein IE4872_PD00297 (plasmid) [Rhizobium gallicum]|uniref:Uncharacterized protein n=1 Tax=Rhizobium gallicum TaxID=56730 RepID=A0A1L5NSH4_9HYPH|nr:hypothetical protein IE4872_PD00297 [Rhizobium gallicum]